MFGAQAMLMKRQDVYILSISFLVSWNSQAFMSIVYFFNVHFIVFECINNFEGRCSCNETDVQPRRKMVNSLDKDNHKTN